MNSLITLWANRCALRPGLWALVFAALFLATAAWPPSSSAYASENLPFKPGERLVFDISWMGILGGEGRMNVREEFFLKNRRVVILEILAKSAGWVRSLYPVDDMTTSFFDVEGKFSRKVEITIAENRYRKKKTIEFEQEAGRAFYKVDGDKAEEFAIDKNSQDSFSALYALRAMGPELKVGEPVMLSIFEDRTKYTLEVSVLRKERIELPQGMVDTVVIEPKLKTEGIFSRRGTMTIWLTDDKSLTPVMMRSKVLIGVFEAALSEYSGVDIRFLPKPQ